MSELVRLPIGAIERSLDAIRRVGAGWREIALFWLGSPDDLVVDLVVLPTGPGVRWDSLSLRLSETWMLALAELCDERGVVVLGGVHSHPEAAFMSPVDRDAFFHAPDFVSVVVPSYGATNVRDAPDRWAVFVGLPENDWRRGRWDVDIALLDGDAPLHELEA